MTYLFRREDNDQIVEVDFETAINQDFMGCITLPDGVVARRCRYLEDLPKDAKPAAPDFGALDVAERPIVSDALGITYQQLAEFEADRVRHGFTGVEFKEDPKVPGFYQAHFTGRKEWQRYIQHRGKTDQNSRLGSGASLSQADLDKAAKLVERNLAERAQFAKSAEA